MGAQYTASEVAMTQVSTPNPENDTAMRPIWEGARYFAHPGNDQRRVLGGR